METPAGGPLPDAGDGARVRPAAARRRGRGRPRARRPAPLGGRLRAPPRRAATRRRTSSRRSTRSAPRRPTWPTSCAARSPTATASSLVQLLAALGLFWTIRGEHIRRHRPGRGGRRGAARLDAARRTWRTPRAARCMITLNNSLMTGGGERGPLPAMLRPAGPRGGRQPAPLRACAGAARVRPGRRSRRPATSRRRLERLRLAADPDRHDGARRQPVAQRHCARTPATRSARSRPPSARWRSSATRTARGPRRCRTAMLAQLTMHVGDRAAAVEHAQAALPVMQRLGASDDELQLRAAAGVLRDRRRAARGRGGRARPDRTDRRALRYVRRGRLRGWSAGPNWRSPSGDLVAGLRIYRECAARMREMRLPGVTRTGLEPWVLFGDVAWR